MGKCIRLPDDRGLLIGASCGAVVAILVFARRPVAEVVAVAAGLALGLMGLGLKLPGHIWKRLGAGVISFVVLAGCGAAVSAMGNRSDGSEVLSSPSPAPATTPQSSLPSEPPTQPPRRTYAEQAWNRGGVPTFRKYHNASDPGPKIPFQQVVQVSCRVYDPTIESANPDGYWYRIATAPWNNAYYAPANAFLNGDPPDGPYTHYTDMSVPLC